MTTEIEKREVSVFAKSRSSYSMDFKKSYISSASAQSLGRICSMGANFIVFVLAARLLGIEVFGQYSFITVFLGLAIMIAEFGTTSVLATDIGGTKDDVSIYWGNFLIMRFLFTYIVAVIALPCAWLTRPDLFPSLAIGLLGLFFLGSRFFDPLFQVYDRPWYSFYGSVVYSVVFAISSITVLYLNRPLFDLIVVYVIANIVYTVFAFRQSLTLVKPIFRLKWNIQKSILALALPIGISSILTLIHTRADTFMLAAMKGDYAVGIYNSAYRFLDMAVIAAVMLSSPMIPILSKLALSDRKALAGHYSRILELLTSIIVPAAILVPIISEPFVNIILGREYSEVASLLNLMAWIGVLTFFSMFNFVVLLAVKVVRFQIWLGVVTALMNVALNYLLIPHFSYNGSAWATLLVECIFVLVSFIYVFLSVGTIFNAGMCLRIGLISLFVFAAVNATLFLDFPWRMVIATIVWMGSLFLFKKPLGNVISR